MRRIHRLHVEIGELLQQADASAGRQRRGAPADRHRLPVLVHHPEILVGATQLAVLGDQPLHHIVHRIEAVGVLLHRPLVERIDVVPGLRLRLGGHGDVDLHADAGEEVELDGDLVLLRPVIDQLLHGGIAGRNPVVPDREPQLACRAGGADVHQRQGGGRRTKLDGIAARHVTTRTGHGVCSLPGRTAFGRRFNRGRHGTGLRPRSRYLGRMPGGWIGRNRRLSGTTRPVSTRNGPAARGKRRIAGDPRLLHLGCRPV